MRWWMFILAAVLVCSTFAFAEEAGVETLGEAETLRETAAAGVRIDNLPRGAVSVQLHVRSQFGRHYYLVTWEDGHQQRLTPNAYARLLYDDRQSADGWVYALLNISTPAGFAWVAMGLLGQLLFTGRMLVQWIASERRRRSIVPPVFWWLSLIGATMLLIYFIWRRDVVGVLGQGAGWFIYMRNLWLIYRPRPHVAAAPSA